MLVGSAAVTAMLILLVPAYLIIRTGSTWADAVETLTRPRTLGVLANTVTLAASVTLATAVLAVSIAWLTARTDLPGRRMWAVLAALPLVVPSYVYAYLHVTFLSPKGLLQQVLEPLGVERLNPVYGFSGAFLVLTLIAYPFTLLTVRAALLRMDPSLTEAARSLGLSPSGRRSGASRCPTCARPSWRAACSSRSTCCATSAPSPCCNTAPSPA